MTPPPRVPGRDQELWLVPGVSCARGDGGLRLASWRRDQALGADLAWKGRLLARLARGPCPRSDLGPVVAGEAGADEVAEFVAGLMAGGWLASRVSHRTHPLYTLLPEGPVPPEPDHVADDLVLSRFTVLRREDDRLVAESPLASARLETREPAVRALLGLLTGPGGTADLAAVPLAPEARTRVLADLQRTGLAVPRTSDEERRAPLRQWSPHELWFHRRSRITDRSYGQERYGRTMWGRGNLDPLPARRDRYSGPEIELYRPSLEGLRLDDAPLTTVLEDRRSVRAHDDDHPLTVDQLGELLYRCARTRATREVDGVEYPSRPYPSGGAVYELELYPVVRLMAGVDPGLYHYDPHGHGHLLRRVRGPGPEVRRLLRMAPRAAPMPGTPQVLIVVTARFGRLAWIYEQMPYSLTLKHVGVLYQSMYLVATAMGLAACGLGGGGATDFNEAAGVGYATESAVGEFLLGSRPPDG